jgi:hypothetical protein
MKIPMLETEEGPIRVPMSAINNLLVRLHNAWKKGDLRWIRGGMTDGGNGYCMLGGIYHMSNLIKQEEGLSDVEAAKLYHDAARAVAEAISPEEVRRASADDTIIRNNDRVWRDLSQPLAAIRKTLEQANA